MKGFTAAFLVWTLIFPNGGGKAWPTHTACRDGSLEVLYQSCASPLCTHSEPSREALPGRPEEKGHSSGPLSALWTKGKASGNDICQVETGTHRDLLSSTLQHRQDIPKAVARVRPWVRLQTQDCKRRCGGRKQLVFQRPSEVTVKEPLRSLACAAGAPRKGQQAPGSHWLRSAQLAEPSAALMRVDTRTHSDLECYPVASHKKIKTPPIKIKIQPYKKANFQIHRPSGLY
ncbi:hypothetical protein MC885_012248, partial [Smutsia gigantea]